MDSNEKIARGLALIARALSLFLESKGYHDSELDNETESLLESTDYLRGKYI